MQSADILASLARADTSRAALDLLRTATGAVGALWLLPNGSPELIAPQDVPFTGHFSTADLHRMLSEPAEAAARKLALWRVEATDETVVVLEPSEALPPDIGPMVSTLLSRVRSTEQTFRGLERERDSMRQRAEESEALHVLGLAANRSLDAEEVLTLVARSTRMLLGAHYVTVGTSDGNSIRTRASAGLRNAVGNGDDALARLAVSGGAVVHAGGAGGHDISLFPNQQAEGMLTGLAVPLSLFGETFGALVVGYRRPYAITPRDERLALALSGHAAVAISNARLHGALSARSAELERTYEELRWSAQAKDRFFASMSHELRTPLNAILGYQSLILDGVVGSLPESVRPSLSSAQRAANSLIRLVNDVLDLSKLEAGKLELLFLTADPRALVREAIQTVNPGAAERPVAIVDELPVDLPPIRTDPHRVVQILVNLLSNAVKFTPSGNVVVSGEVVESWGDGQGDELRVHVTDTGTGVAMEDQERIFHEFEQVGGHHPNVGTGLGLPISRKLARLLGGDITVRSAPGRGSTFTLSLPLQPRDLGGM